jgi:hypothetical protein
MLQERHKTQNHETTKSQTLPVHHLTGINTKMMEVRPCPTTAGVLSDDGNATWCHSRVKTVGLTLLSSKLLQPRPWTSICFSNWHVDMTLNPYGRMTTVQDYTNSLDSVTLWYQTNASTEHITIHMMIVSPYPAILVSSRLTSNWW